MTRRAEQLALQSLFDQQLPGSGHVGAHCEALRSRVDVIKMQVLGRAASNALPAEHLDQPRAPGMLPSFDVAAHVLGASWPYLTNRNDADTPGPCDTLD